MHGSPWHSTAFVVVGYRISTVTSKYWLMTAVPCITVIVTSLLLPAYVGQDVPIDQRAVLHIRLWFGIPMLESANRYYGLPPCLCS